MSWSRDLVLRPAGGERWIKRKQCSLTNRFTIRFFTPRADLDEKNLSRSALQVDSWSKILKPCMHNSLR